MQGDWRRPLSEGTIRSVLLYLRAEAIREGAPGLEHVEALLTARGIDPEAQRVPTKYQRRFRRGQFRSALIGLLRERPRTAPEIAAEIARRYQFMPYKDAYIRTYSTLRAMRRRGAVVSEKDRAGRYVWRLVDRT